MTKRRPMSEKDWLTSDSAADMIHHLFQHARISRVPGGQRRLLLFRCACCRMIWDIFDDDQCRQAVEVSERCADKRGSRAELAAIQETTEELARAARQQMSEVARRSSAVDQIWKEARHWQEITSAAFWTTSSRSVERSINIVTLSIHMARATRDGVPLGSSEAAILLKEQERLQAQLVRDIFGNPFRQITLDPTCRSSTVQALAQEAYEQRTLPSGELDRDRLLVLADALDEAGGPAELSEHLRGPGPHVRGCFAVDACLNRT